MRFAYDKITGALENYASAHAPRLVKKVLDLHGPYTRLVVNKSSYLEMDRSEYFIDANNLLAQEIRDVCLRNNLFRALILARKVPFSFLASLLPSSDPLLSNTAHVKYSCFSEAALLIANNILKYSSVQPAPESINDRNTFVPTPSEMEDAISLSLCTFIHRYNTYYLNTQARRNLTGEVAYEALTSIYNRRMINWNPISSVSEDINGDVMLGLTSPQIFGGADRVKFHFSSQNTFIELLLPNYFPLAVRADAYLRQYAYLNDSGFASVTGLSFDTFYECWLAFQRLALNSLPLKCVPGQTYNIKPSDMKFVERLFDVCETGLGGAPRKKLINTVMEFTKTKSTDLSVSEQDVTSFLNFSTCKRLDENPGFPEQPYLFYEVGDGLLLWDYLRHLGFWKSLARTLVTRYGIIGNQKGAFLEQDLWDALSTLPTVTQLRKNIKISRGKSAGASMEIDVGFVWHNVLIVLEAKSWFKRIQYYSANVVEVADRQQRVRGVLTEIDEDIKSLKPLLGKHWELDLLLGCLPIVVSDEVEFIASFDPTWWLIPGEVPRVCLAEELLRFLEESHPTALENHPAFVSFQM